MAKPYYQWQISNGFNGFMQIDDHIYSTKGKAIEMAIDYGLRMGIVDREDKDVLYKEIEDFGDRTYNSYKFHIAWIELVEY